MMLKSGSAAAVALCLSTACAEAAVVVAETVAFDGASDRYDLGLLEGEGAAFSGFAMAGTPFTHVIGFAVPDDGDVSFSLSIPQNGLGFSIQDLTVELYGVSIDFGALLLGELAASPDILLQQENLGSLSEFASFELRVLGLAGGSFGGNWAGNLTVTPLPGTLVALATALGVLSLVSTSSRR